MWSCGAGRVTYGGGRTPVIVAQIPKENIEQVLSATDIVDLVNSYVPLKRAGSQYRANCPFHSEKTPSFYVNPARQSFHCFGCGKGGDAIAVVREYENLPFMEAVRKNAGAKAAFLISTAKPRSIFTNSFSNPLMRRMPGIT